MIYRLGFAVARRQARQLVRHGHIAVNGRKVNIPSYQVSVGEEIAVRENSKKLVILEAAKEFASHQTSPNWLEIDRENYKGRVLSLATARRHQPAGERTAHRGTVQQVARTERCRKSWAAVGPPDS